MLQTSAWPCRPGFLEVKRQTTRRAGPERHNDMHGQHLPPQCLTAWGIWGSRAMESWRLLGKAAIHLGTQVDAAVIGGACQQQMERTLNEPSKGPTWSVGACQNPPCSCGGVRFERRGKSE
jgi:hypothetical protein